RPTRPDDRGPRALAPRVRRDERRLAAGRWHRSRGRDAGGDRVPPHPLRGRPEDRPVARDAPARRARSRPWRRRCAGASFAATGLTVAPALVLVTLLAASELSRGARERGYADLERAATGAWPALRSDPAARVADWPVLAERAAARLGVRVTLIDSSGRVVGD